jgi:hypothetical protein
MWKQAGVGACFLVVLVGCAAVLLTVTAATAEPKAIVVLSSLHNLDYAEAACSRLHSMADMKDITEVLNNASDYDPEDVKFNKQLFDGIWECKSVKDARELGRRLEDSIEDQFAVNTRCTGVAAYIEGYDKFDGKFNAVAMQVEERNDYWDLMVDYAPGSKVYSWALFPTARSGRPNGRMISGEGTVSQIAEQVCIVVTGHGASVR